MTVIASFAELPVKEQFDSWSHTISQTYVPLVATRYAGKVPFGGELVSQTIGSAHISEVTGGACAVARTAQTIRECDPGVLKLGLQLHGYCVLTQDGREAALTPGDLAIYDTRRQYQLSFDGTFKCLVVMFPRELLPLRGHELGQFTARRMSGRQGIGGLVAPLLLNMGRQMRMDELSANVELSSAVVNMLAAAISEQLGCESRVPPETHRAAMILRIKAFVDARLEDPELSSAGIAHAHNISPRYLQKLFESAGTTVTDWIRQRRLEHCQNDLLDPRFADMSIGAIAARWGMIDSSYFSRLFKTAYGTTPREFRAHAGEPARIGKACAGSDRAHRSD
jgi:AraC-like DNA-binding protein